MPDNSLVAPSEPLLRAVDALERVVEALRAGDDPRASALLGDVEEQGFRDYWVSGGLEYDKRHRTDAHVASEAPRVTRTIDRVTRKAVVERDGWRCRYCGLRLVAPDLVSELHARCPKAFPWGSKDASRHGLGLVLRYTPDHVFPWRLGGTNDPDNLVATCSTCNFQKGSCTLEELGLTDPRTRPPVVDSWSGYSGVLAKARY